MYYKGEGVEKDSKKAIEWYEKAASQGFAKAQYNLGVMYDNGYGVEVNEQKAYELLQKSLNQGNPKAQAYITNFCKKNLEICK